MEGSTTCREDPWSPVVKLSFIEPRTLLARCRVLVTGRSCPAGDSAERRSDRGRRHPHVRRAGGPRVRGLVESRSLPALVGAEVDGDDAAVVRDGRPHRRHPPPRRRRRCGVHGRYLEVIAPARIVWTNEEGGARASVTTVTFTETDGRTHVVVSELFPSKEALEAEVAARPTRCTRPSPSSTSCSPSSRRPPDRAAADGPPRAVDRWRRPRRVPARVKPRAHPVVLRHHVS